MAAILDHAKSLGRNGCFRRAQVGNLPYLSAGYFQAVKILVEEAGNAICICGSTMTADIPLACRRQIPPTSARLAHAGLASPSASPSPPGQQYSYQLDARTICVLAVNLDSGAAQVLDSRRGP